MARGGGGGEPCSPPAAAAAASAAAAAAAASWSSSSSLSSSLSPLSPPPFRLASSASPRASPGRSRAASLARAAARNSAAATERWGGATRKTKSKQRRRRRRRRGYPAFSPPVAALLFTPIPLRYPVEASSLSKARRRAFLRAEALHELGLWRGASDDEGDGRRGFRRCRYRRLRLGCLLVLGRREAARFRRPRRQAYKGRRRRGRGGDGEPRIPARRRRRRPWVERRRTAAEALPSWGLTAEAPPRWRSAVRAGGWAPQKPVGDPEDFQNRLRHAPFGLFESLNIICL